MPCDDLVVGQDAWRGIVVFSDAEDARDLGAVRFAIRSRARRAGWWCWRTSREPIALHWPVIEFAPVPGRPMLPVISARLMIACAVRVALVALVDAHRPPERDALARRRSFGRIARTARRSVPVSAQTRSRVKLATNSANSSKPVVCASMNVAVDPAVARSGGCARP